MNFIAEFLMKSGFSDLFVFACVSFFLAKFVMAQDWHRDGMNNLRNAISIAFYVFGVCLLLAVLITLPQCHGPNKQNTEQQNNAGQIKPDNEPPAAQQKDGSTK